MSQSPDLLDLSITLTPPPAGSPLETLATITLQCSAPLGLSHTGDLLKDPLSSQEREDLRWYLEEYWQWPFEGFAERAKRVEALLPLVGKRLYDAVFSRQGARDLLQTCRLDPSGSERQISILSGLPHVLSLPWELLHDAQGFLVLRTRHPVVLLRRLPQGEAASFATPFEPPLRVLLVTARPEEAGFIDPRNTARELLDEVEEQVEQGRIAVEFLRPPTLPALRNRLADENRPPIHVLHFDGHGAFGSDQLSHDGLTLGGQAEGLLAFEDAEGQRDLVKAKDVVQVLQDSGIRLAVLTACRSATSSEEALSSV